MSLRVPVAVVGGIVGLVLYIMAAVAVADVVVPLNWAVQLAFYTVVGFVWVFPIKWLMFWSVHQR